MIFSHILPYNLILYNDNVILGKVIIRPAIEGLILIEYILLFELIISYLNLLINEDIAWNLVPDKTSI